MLGTNKIVKEGKMVKLRSNQTSLRKTFFLTKSGLDDLKNRLNTLMQDRMNIRERLRTMDPQERMYSIVSSDEIQMLELAEIEATKIANILEHAEVVATSKNPTSVQVGSKVTLNNGPKSVTYTIVDHLEVDPLAGKISEEGPFGQALLGKKVGDRISITTPKGKESNYEIVDIE
jgi:transcription elongation factor GreA